MKIIPIICAIFGMFFTSASWSDISNGKAYYQKYHFNYNGNLKNRVPEDIWRYHYISNLDSINWSKTKIHTNNIIFVNNTLASILWNKRILILNTTSKNSSHYKNLLEFESKFDCEIKNRNLLIIKFINGRNLEYDNLMILLELTKKYGFTLIGYDGQIKMYFNDPKGLISVFNKIDRMPIRKAEMKNDKECV